MVRKGVRHATGTQLLTIGAGGLHMSSKVPLIET